MIIDCKILEISVHEKNSLILWGTTSLSVILLCVSYSLYMYNNCHFILISTIYNYH